MRTPESRRRRHRRTGARPTHPIPGLQIRTSSPRTPERSTRACLASPSPLPSSATTSTAEATAAQGWDYQLVTDDGGALGLFTGAYTSMPRSMQVVAPASSGTPQVTLGKSMGTLNSQFRLAFDLRIDMDSLVNVPITAVAQIIGQRQGTIMELNFSLLPSGQGQLESFLTLDGGPSRKMALPTIPLRRWTRVVLAYDTSAGISVLEDGQIIGSDPTATAGAPETTQVLMGMVYQLAPGTNTISARTRQRRLPGPLGAVLPVSREHSPPVVIGRYALYDEIASGGHGDGAHRSPARARSASRGPSRSSGCTRTSRRTRSSSRCSSTRPGSRRASATPTWSPTLDVVAMASELFLVMEYVHGESLSRLMRAAQDGGRPIPLPVVSAIIIGVLARAPRRARGDERTRRAAGDRAPRRLPAKRPRRRRRRRARARLRVAKAARAPRTHGTGRSRESSATWRPSSSRPRRSTAASDVYAASVVLWECITGNRLLPGESELRSMVTKVLSIEVAPPSRHAKNVPPELDALVLRGLEKDPAKRVPTAREMARALQKIVPAAPASDVAESVESVAGTFIDERARRVALIEQATPTHRAASVSPPAPSRPPASDAKRSSDSTTLAGSAASVARSARSKYFVFSGVALVVVAAAVLFKAAESRPRALPLDPVAASTATPPPAAEPPPRPATPVPVNPPAEPPLAAALSPAPPASPAPVPMKKAPVDSVRKHPAGSEFDHVMDSRK